MKIVDIFTDFDGTVTGRAGNSTVFTAFYQSLLEGYKPGKTQEYKAQGMKSADEVQHLFEEKFGSYNEHFNYQQRDSDLLMPHEAVIFFHELLKHERVRISIITRNREDYIKALFRYQGFSSEEIAKLTICPSGFKKADVTKLLNQHEENRATQIYILDDFLSDFNGMTEAVLISGYPEEAIHGHHLAPGQFEWLQYLSEIERFLTNDETSDISGHENEDPKAKSEPRVCSRTLKIVGFTTIGFILGLVLGSSLAATGVFAPFGLSILAILTFGTVLGTGSALFSLVIVITLTEATARILVDKEEPRKYSYSGSMSELRPSSSSQRVERPKVEHYPGVIIAPGETDFAEPNELFGFNYELKPN